MKIITFTGIAMLLGYGLWHVLCLFHKYEYDTEEEFFYDAYLTCTDLMIILFTVGVILSLM